MPNSSQNGRSAADSAQRQQSQSAGDPGISRTVEDGFSSTSRVGHLTPPWLGYCLAVATTASAALTNVALEVSTRESTNGPYLLATIVTAWFAGLAPALVATGLSAAAVAYASNEGWMFADLGSLDVGGAVVFGAVSAFAAWLTVGRRDTQRAREALLLASEEHRHTAETENRAKDGFLAILSHELRTPMTAISVASSVLDRLDLQNTDASRACAVIARQTMQVCHIIDDLLDARRLATGKLSVSRSPLDLADTVRRCVEALDLGGQAARHELRCVVESVWIDADETRIEHPVRAHP